MGKRKVFCNKLFAGAIATVLGLSPLFGSYGTLQVEAAGIAKGSGSYSTEVVGQYSYTDDSGNLVYVNNSSLLQKLPYKGSAYRYTTDNYDANNGAFDTTNWATSFMWDLDGDQPYSSQVYAIPFAYKGESYGLQVTAPSSLSDTANKVYTMQMAEDGTLTDFFVKTGFSSSQAKVDAVTDWSYDIIWENTADSTQYMKATLVQGVPFAYFQTVNSDTLTFERGRTGLPSAVVYQSEDGSFVIVRCYDNGDNDYDYYAFYAAQGTTWDISTSGTNVAKLVADMPASKTYVSMAYLGSVKSSPDDAWALNMGNAYYSYAYNYITDTKAVYSYDEAASTVTTTYIYTFDKKAESTADGTVMGILPHQYKNMPADTAYTDYTYETIRGTMKIILGSSFTTYQTYSGILPYMPDIEESCNEELSAYLDEYIADFGEDYFDNYEGCGDTYWDGKGLNRLVNAMIAAEDAGDAERAELLLNALRSRLEDWFTYSGSDDDAYFFYDEGVGSLFGFPQSYSSVDQINDHHFHYGYFIYAAAQVAMRVDNWGEDNQYGAMVKELIYDIACPERNNANSKYPYLRSFAPYEGHSWASGHQNFGMGNNQESSSEALNAWAGIILFGEAVGDDAIRDLGVYLYTTESSAVNNYWFDVDEDVLSDAYRYGVSNAAVDSINKETDEVKYNSAAIVWGGSYTYATWFSANPLHIQGINLLPMNPTGFYLAGNKEYIEENIRLAYKYAAAGGWSDTEWIDIWCEYQALADPEEALLRWQQAEAAGYGVEGGETKAHTYHFIRSLCRYGTPDTSITGDCALSTVFVKDGVKTYAAYNADDTAKEVFFSDGGYITVAPGTMYAGAGGTGNTEAEADKATYIVEYYQQNLAQDGYELAATRAYRVAKDTVVNVLTTDENLVKEYTGFTLNTAASGSLLQGTVSADNSLVLKLYYDRETYSLGYQAAGGIIPANPTSYVYGSSVTLQDPYLAGYLFEGWFKDAALTKKIESITETTSGNMTLFAKWADGNEHSLGIGMGANYADTDNGTVTFYVTASDSVLSSTVYWTSYDNLADAQAKVSANTVAGTNGQNLTASGDLLTATATGISRGSYIVYKFNINGNSETAFGLYQIPREAPVAEPDYSGYVDDVETDNPVVEVYTITYVLNGGTNNAANPTSYTAGQGAELYNPAKSDAEFLGWYTDAAFTHELTEISTEQTGNITLYAKWETNESSGDESIVSNSDFTYDSQTGKATFTCKGATGGIVYIAAYDSLDTANSIAAKANAAAPGFSYVTGHGGYMLSATGTAEYSVAEGKYLVYAFNPNFKGVGEWKVGVTTAGESESPVEPVITYADYTVRHYKQNTAQNGYDLASESTKEGVVGETVTADANTYTGFTLDSAQSTASGTVAEDNSLLLTFYYTRNSYSITYSNMEGATNAADNASSYVYGVGLVLADPAKEGYTFEGWYSDENLSDKLTAIGTEMTDAVTVYAKWTKNATDTGTVTGDTSGYTYDKDTATATFYYNGVSNGIVYIATYDTQAKAEEIAAKANASAPGFAFVTGHGGYMLTADGSNAKASYPVEEGKYMVYAFNPGFSGVTQWYVGVASETKQNDNTVISGGEVSYNAASGIATFTCEGASSGIVYIASYDSPDTANSIAAKANATAPGFEFVTGHGGYMMSAGDGAAVATYNPNGKKYLVYAFNPDFKGVEEWKIYIIE